MTGCLLTTGWYRRCCRSREFEIAGADASAAEPQKMRRVAARSGFSAAQKQQEVDAFQLVGFRAREGEGGGSGVELNHRLAGLRRP